VALEFAFIIQLGEIADSESKSDGKTREFDSVLDSSRRTGA
jgi:hypothetical protein